MAKGKKTGGRTPGTPNNVNSALSDKLALMGAKPDEFLAHVMLNDILCVHCTIATRDDCEVCFGTGKEPVPLAMRKEAARDLMPFVHPKLASKTVDKTVSRVILARMNHLTQEEAEVVQGKVDDAKENGELDD